MTRQEFARLYYADPFARREFDDCRPVEHVTMVGDGLEDYHSTDRARLMLEVGYWGTLDLGC